MIPESRKSNTNKTEKNNTELSDTESINHFGHFEGQADGTDGMDEYMYYQYFIQAEKAWNTPELLVVRALQMANQTVEQYKQQNTSLATDPSKVRLQTRQNGGSESVKNTGYPVADKNVRNQGRGASEICGNGE